VNARLPKYGLRSLFLVTALAAAVLAVLSWSGVFAYRGPPLERIQQLMTQAVPVVDALEAYHQTHRDYPTTLDEAGIAHPRIDGGWLIYERFGPHLGEVPPYQLTLCLRRYGTVGLFEYDSWRVCVDGRDRYWTQAEARQNAAAAP
jgi:hypothetical protein